MESKKTKNRDPHRMQAIAWRDGYEKQIVVNCLNHPQVSCEMPENIRGNAGQMVLWGARKLRELGMSGKLAGAEPTLFSDKPEEVKELESRIQALERSLYMCQTAVKAAKVGIRMAPGNALGIINDCLNTVVANSPTFMGEAVSEPENEREG